MSQEQKHLGTHGPEAVSVPNEQIRLTIEQARIALEKFSQVDPKSVTSFEDLQVFQDLPGVFEVAATHIVSHASIESSIETGPHFGQLFVGYKYEKNKGKKQRILLKYQISEFPDAPNGLPNANLGRQHVLLTNANPDFHRDWIRQSTPSTISMLDRSEPKRTLFLKYFLKRHEFESTDLTFNVTQEPNFDHTLSSNSFPEQITQAAGVIVHMAKLLHEWSTPQKPQIGSLRRKK